MPLFNEAQAPSQKYLVGINTKVVGKADQTKLSGLGAWRSASLTIEELASHISKGHPWMPAVLDEGSRRFQHLANYAAVLAADIDGVITIEQAMKLPIVIESCALIIESTSSTTEHNKFRLVFPLEQPLTVWTDIRLANIHLIATLREQSGINSKTAVDQACKDASRFFFGGLGRTPRLLNNAAVLPEGFISEAREREAIVEREFQAELQIRQAALATSDKDRTLRLVIDALSSIPPYTAGNNTYDSLLTMCAGVLNDLGSVGLSVLEAWGGWGPGTTAKMQGLMLSKVQRSASIGSLFHLAKDYGWRFPEATPEEKKAYAIKMQAQEAARPKSKPAVVAPTAKRPGHLAIFMGDKSQAITIAAQHQMETIAITNPKAAYSIPGQLEQLEWPKNILLIPAAGDIANPTAIKAYRHIASTIERENIAGKENQGKHWNPIILSVWWEGQWDGNAVKIVANTFTWKQWFSASVGTDANAYKEWVEARAFTPDHTVNTKYFQFRQPNEGEMMIVRSGLGTGKTHWAIESVYKKMSKRAIFIVPTNNLGRSLNERSGASFMRELSTGTQYDTAYKATDVDVVTLCLDSILLVSVEQATGAVVFIDELEIVMRVLAFGSTHIRKIRQEAADHLRAVLAVAHSVVGLDGGMTDRIAGFLHELCPSKKMVKVLNSHSNTMTFNVDLGSEDEYKGRLAKSIARANEGTDRPLFLATDSKADGRVNIQFPLNADTIKESLLQADGSLLAGWGEEMAKSPTEFIRENKAKTASVSPAGGAGLSFDLYDYFGSNPVLGMGVVGPADLMQLAGRVRDNSIVRDFWVAERGLKEYWILDADAVTEMAVGEALFRFLQETISTCEVPDMNKALKLMKNLHKAIEVDPIAQFVIKEQALRAYECKHLRGLTIAAARMNGHIVNLVTHEETELDAELTKEAVKEHKAAKRCHKLDFIGRFQFAAVLNEQEEQAANNADRLAPGMPERLALTAIVRKYPGIQNSAQWNDMSDNEKGEITSHVFIDRLPKFGKKATEFFLLVNFHVATNNSKRKFNKWLNEQSIDLTQLGSNHPYRAKMHKILTQDLTDFVGLNYKTPIDGKLIPHDVEGCLNKVGTLINIDLLKQITDKLLTGTEATRKTLNGKSRSLFLKHELEAFGFDVEKMDNGELYVTAPCLDPETDLGAVYGAVCSRFAPKKAEDEQPHEWEFTASVEESDDLEGEFSAIVRGETEEGWGFEVDDADECCSAIVYEFEGEEAERSPVSV